MTSGESSDCPNDVHLIFWDTEEEFPPAGLYTCSDCGLVIPVSSEDPGVFEVGYVDEFTGRCFGCGSPLDDHRYFNDYWICR